MAIKQYQHKSDGRNDTDTVIYVLRGNNRVIFKDGVLRGDIDIMNDRAKEFLQQRLTFGIVEEKE